MKCDPYVPSSVTNKKAWDEVASILGLHPVVARQVYLDRWYTMDKKDFFALVRNGEFTKKDFDVVKMTQEELDAEYVSWCDAMKERDFSDLMYYRLKQIIEVGDETVCNETKTYCFSGKQYQTQGKRYKIENLYDEGNSEFRYQTTTDLPTETNWGSFLGCKSIWRGDKEIWNWSIAWLELWKEQNPGHPETASMEEHCNQKAENLRLGKEYNA